MLPSQSQAKVKELLQSGQKIAAIQFLCNQHQLSLADAKDWVAYLAGEATRPGAQPSTASPAVMRARVEDLLRSNNKIQAIKMVMDEYRISLRQAKRLVDTVASRQGFALPQDAPGIVFFVLAAVGTIFILLSMYWLGADYIFTSKAETVTGTVVDLSYGRGSGNTAAPVVSYTWQGKEMIFEGSTYSNPPAVEIGEQVELFVNPDNPNDVLINLVSERYILIFIFGFIGFVLSLIGYLGLGLGGKR
ncbi:MAG: DUF3592 domain-containing protein [Cyclobacteriaceae bacterium]|nr:DUF3592 domain-containing protein [Cyclobacteriaceae bacterium]